MTDRISIKADREYLREIFRKIENGEYAVPVFQRDYVWKASQIIALFDSILRGYPIGSLVLWKSKDVHQSKQIITDEIIDAPAPNYYILDGRQRMTTLFGVISKGKEATSRFDLFFNLEKQVFEFPQKDAPYLVRVSVVYDTFSLLDWMSKIPSLLKNEEKARLYITRAKNLNSILQEYIVSEILIDQCDLSEAGVVFSRINSTGTKIESLDMLQAVKYRGDNSALISSCVQKIQKRLEPFGFQNLHSKDILNCCFWYTDRKYYDSKIESLDRENLEIIFPQVEEALIRALSFLRTHCGVISLRLLPYTKQLLALVWVFKDTEETDPKRLEEIRRWFIYSTYNQLFMNGSLQHIRNVHNRLEDFILGEKDTAFDYEEVSRPFFNYRFSSTSAQTRFMVLAIIRALHNKNIPLDEMSFSGYDHPFKGNTPLSYIPRILVQGKKMYIEDSSFEMSPFDSDSDDTVLKGRQELLYRLECELLASAGIVVRDDESV